MERRKFIKGTSTALAATALPKVSYAKRSPNETINVAVVGIRGRGKNHYADRQKQQNVNVTHVVEVDDAVVADKLPDLKEKYGGDPKVVKDLRHVLDDKDVDVISIATPDHWHALQTIWSCQAGKDVYVEKPISHNVFEGRQAVNAARKYDRIVAAGTQSRSKPVFQRAMKFLHDGGIGKLFGAKALCYKPRNSIGYQADSEVPEGLDYDLWLGPAPWRPYNANRIHYTWHWHWDTGTTDMGNQGIHQMDIMRWGMDKTEYPHSIKGIGGLYEAGERTTQETPNTQYSTFQYDDGTVLHFEVRGWYSPDEMGVKIGNHFFGSEGWMSVSGSDINVYMGKKNLPLQWDTNKGDDDGVSHFANFIEAVRAHDSRKLNADILEGHLSSALCHLGNVSYRVGGRLLKFDSHSERFVRDDQANAYLTRKYRHPFVVPQNV